MEKTFAPDSCRELIVEAFTDPVNSAYGQLATVDAGGMPQVRTVHWHYIKERDCLAFMAHSSSAKLEQLGRDSRLSGCYYYADINKLFQLRWEGKAQLLDDDAKSDNELLQKLWGSMRAQVRSAYWADKLLGEYQSPLGADVDIDKRCPTCRAVLCPPTKWDIYDVDPLDYQKGLRTIHMLEDGRWRSERISLLHNGPATII